MATRLYIVKAGDSLSIIARDQLSDLSRWRELAYINSLAAPYVIQPGQALQLPVDSGPIDVVVTSGTRAPTTNGAADTKQAGFNFTPTTLIMLALAAVAVFMFMQDD